VPIPISTIAECDRISGICASCLLFDPYNRKLSHNFTSKMRFQREITTFPKYNIIYSTSRGDDRRHRGADRAWQLRRPSQMRRSADVAEGYRKSEAGVPDGHVFMPATVPSSIVINEFTRPRKVFPRARGRAEEGMRGHRHAGFYRSGRGSVPPIHFLRAGVD
jgi:hypothetical protein